MPPASPSPAKRLQKLLLTLLKLSIAVVGIWIVARNVAWNDTADLRAGAVLNAVTFPDKVTVRVLSQQAVGERKLVRIEFPTDPVPVEVNGVRQNVVVAENTPVEGGGTLGLAREKEIPRDHLDGDHIHEGLRSLALRASGQWHLMLAAWGMLAVPFLVTAIRWRNLMRPQGINMPLGKCIQLTFVGQFYSIMLPGITGGDLVKIVYAARLTGSKTKSFITIVLDRVIGLVALMAIAGTSAGVQLLLAHRDGKPLDNTFLNVFLMITALLGGLAVAAMIYFSRRLRRLSGIEWFIEHLGSAQDNAVEGRAKLERLFRITNASALGVALAVGGTLALLRWGVQADWALRNMVVVCIGIGIMAAVALAAGLGLLLHGMLAERTRPLMSKVVGETIKIDETLHVYRGHFGLLFWAFLISVISQLTLPLSAWLSGTALGMNAPVTYYMAYVPLAVLAASLPISPPQGLGFLEWVLDHFFVSRGTATGSQAFALTQAVRFLPLLWNLCGAYWVVTGKFSRKKEGIE